MSYESALNLIDKCSSGKNRYLAYYSSEVAMLKNNFSGWHDDVGTEASKSLTAIGSLWSNSVSDGFGCAQEGATAVKSAYSTLKSVRQKTEHAIKAIDKAMAEIQS